MPIVAAAIIAPLFLFMNIGFWFPSHGKGGTGGYPAQVKKHYDNKDLVRDAAQYEDKNGNLYPVSK